VPVGKRRFGQGDTVLVDFNKYQVHRLYLVPSGKRLRQLFPRLTIRLQQEARHWPRETWQ
jgi:hypothetical protein